MPGVTSFFFVLFNSSLAINFRILRPCDIIFFVLFNSSLVVDFRILRPCKDALS